MEEKIGRRPVGSLTLIEASTLDEARERFFEHRESLAAIALDACLHGDEPDTLPLLAEMRASDFQGPIIACSSSPDYRQELMKAGCDFESSKEKLPKLLKKLLLDN